MSQTHASRPFYRYLAISSSSYLEANGMRRFKNINLNEPNDRSNRREIDHVIRREINTHHNYFFYLSFIMSRLLTDLQKIEIVKKYQNNSAKETAAYFNFRYPDRPIRLNERTVRKIVAKFNKEGTITRKKVPNPKCKTTNPEIIHEIITIFEQNPGTSLRQAQRDTGYSINTILKCLKAKKFHAYKFARTFEQKYAIDPPNRLNYCNDIINKVESDPGFLSRVLWSDESMFLLNGLPNKQNYR